MKRFIEWLRGYWVFSLRKDNKVMRKALERIAMIYLDPDQEDSITKTDLWEIVTLCAIAARWATAGEEFDLDTELRRNRD